jgi:hypothetical protein
MTGISDWGELLVEEQGQQRLLDSGEISVLLPEIPAL